MSQAEFDALVKKIEGSKRGGNFDPFIDFIQFPKYRNFQKGVRVNFKFPLTVLVGQNGSGKTSLLHALSGSPENTSVGNWWFGTSIDPIDSETEDGKRVSLSEKEKSAFWYEYKSGGEIHQVLKMRIRRPGDPDYWEPSRPVRKHGMKLLAGKKRSPAITMEVAYLNFKTQLNAFDRCFYFHPKTLLNRFVKTRTWQTIVKTGKRSAPRISDYLRDRSRSLRRVLLDRATIKAGPNEMHHPVVELTPNELSAVSQIIGRTYTAGVMVEHRFYETWGISVLFTDSQRTYSEAYAGSGEAAVVRLVHEIMSSKSGRLILLDEPETSLHPGAQEQLLLFLLKHVLEKKLQIVVSTHSPAFVRHLPTDAIKVMSTGPDGHVQVSEGVSPDEAFFVLGHPPESKIHVIVEDILAKTIADAVLNELGPALTSRVSVQFRPGGDTGIKHDAAVFMTASGTKPYLILDGDKRPIQNQFDTNAILMSATAATLDEQIRQKLGVAIQFKQDSGMPEEEKKKIRIMFMSYCNENLKYFPFDTPERAIWNDEVADHLLSSVLGSRSAVETVMTQIIAAQDHKRKFDLLTNALEPQTNRVTGREIQTIQGMFIKRFCAQKDSTFLQTADLLKELK